MNRAQRRAAGMRNPRMKVEDIRLSDGPLDAKEARGIAAIVASQKGLKVRHVQDEPERARLQAAERNGHIWRIGEPYFLVSEILKAKR